MYTNRFWRAFMRHLGWGFAELQKPAERDSPMSRHVLTIRLNDDLEVEVRARTQDDKSRLKTEAAQAGMTLDEFIKNKIVFSLIAGDTLSSEQRMR